MSDPAPALEAGVARARTGLRRLAPPPDLVESLFFGWFDRPYRRATIAVALKTVAVLERELRLRRKGNGAIRDDELAAMSAWLESAPTRAKGPPVHPGFHPGRALWRWPPGKRPLTGERSGTSSDATVSAKFVGGLSEKEPAPFSSRFVFVDHATATRRNPEFADFDLLACLGLGAYGVPPQQAAVAERLAALASRAKALGVRLVLPESVPPAADLEGVWLQPVTLRELLSGATGQQRPLAIVDPLGGESWGESLARRSLLRACARDRSVVAANWVAPHGSGRGRRGPADSGAIQAAMWVQALEGQQLGVIEGWRDLRDGSASPHPAWTTHPAQVETVAHTALDLLFFRDDIAALTRSSAVLLAVVMDGSAVDSADGNRWSAPAAKLFNTLVNRQLRFDVVPYARLGDGMPAPCRTVLIGCGGEEAESIAEQARSAVDREVRVLLPPEGGAPEALAAFVERLPDSTVSPSLRAAGATVAYDPDGRVAAGCWVLSGRTAAGRACVAVANLRAQARRIVVGWGDKGPGEQGTGLSPGAPRTTVSSGRPARQGDGPLSRVRDLLTGETFEPIGGGVPLAAHQVRLLAATTARPGKGVRD